MEFKPYGELLQDVQEHLKFLKEISPELHQDHVIQNAIRRYETIWLPLVARNAQYALVPPQDVAWVWHVHMLCPSAYASDCTALVGSIPDHAFTGDHELSRRLWSSATTEPWSVTYNTISPHCSQIPTKLKYDIRGASHRQQSFYYNVSLPHFSNPTFLQKALERYKKFIQWSVTTVSCSSCRCMTLTCCGIPTSCDLSTTLGIWRRSWALSWIMMIPRRIDPRDRNWARPQRPQRECGPMPIPASPTSPMAHSTEGRTRKVFYTKWQKNKKNVYLIILTKSTWYLCLWLVWVRSTKSKARYHINIGAKYIHTISLNFLDPEWVPMRCGRIKNYSSSWCPPIIYSALWSWNCRKMMALGESLENRYQNSK